MLDKDLLVTKHGYKPCVTDLDCGGSAPIPTTKPYHYECDSKSKSLRDGNDFYYQCIKVNIPGSDTCKYDLIGVEGVKNKDLIDRLIKTNGSKIDLSNYSTQCKNLTIPATTTSSTTTSTKPSVTTSSPSTKPTTPSTVSPSNNYRCNVLGECIKDKYGAYNSLSSCQKVCAKTPTKPTACVVSGFDIDPRTLGLLSISFGKKFSSVWFTNGDCSYCELWMLPVSASTGEPKKQADGYTDMEYVKVGSDLPIYSGNFGSEIPYYFTNKTRGDYKYKLRCYGSDSVDET